jgi:hypothetical protein
MGLPRELRTRHNMLAIYCENRNGATLQTLLSGPRSGHGPRSAVVRAGLGTTRLALSFWPRGWIRLMELYLICVVVGFVLGYGVREAMSRYRRANARRQRGSSRTQAPLK